MTKLEVEAESSTEMQKLDPGLQDKPPSRKAKIEAEREEVLKAKGKIVKYAEIAREAELELGQLVKEKSKSPIVFSAHALCLSDNEIHETLKSWLARMLPLRVVNPYGSKTSIYVVDELMKPAIRSLISMTYDMEKEGYSLCNETFTKDNFVVCKGKIKPISLFVRKRVLGNGEAFECLSRFILSTLFVGRENNIPLDMSRLLQLLETKASKNRLLIENHFALMNVRARRNYICAWYDIQEQFDSIEDQQYTNLCAKLPNLKDWPTLLEKGSPLEMVYLKGKYKYKVTEQPRFFRNSLEHLLENSCPIPWQPPLYVYDDCINMLFAVFSKTICDIVELLPSHHLLKILGPDKYFPGCSK